MNGLVVSAKILFKGKTILILAGMNLAFKGSIVSSDMLAIFESVMRLYSPEEAYLNSVRLANIRLQQEQDNWSFDLTRCSFRSCDG
jgi:hypothetical protein